MSKRLRELQDIKKNFLYATIMDENPTENQGNDDHALPTLLEAYGLRKTLSRSRRCNQTSENFSETLPEVHGDC